MLVSRNIDIVSEWLYELQNLNAILDSPRLFNTNAVILFSNRRLLYTRILEYFKLPLTDENRKLLRHFKDISKTIDYLIIISPYSTFTLYIYQSSFFA